MMRLKTLDLDESITQSIDTTFLKYMEGTQIRMSDNLSAEKTIWMKPQITAPQGSTIWAASTMRTISVVSHSDYMVQNKGYHQKNYTLDFLPLQEGRNHLFARYEFKVTSPDTVFYLKTNCSDKYLLDYLRLKIIDKANQNTVPNISFNQSQLSNASLPPNEEGYLLTIEGAMPYNTTEGQLQIEILSNEDSFDLTEIVGCEPVEYTDAYSPWKYGIIFKEKIFTSPHDHTNATINVRLMHHSESLNKSGTLRYFKVQILDNDQVVLEKKGWNQINISNFLFRMNAGLEAPGSDSGNGE
jgi:hypothetical protein